MSAALQDDSDQLNSFERAFFRAVLEYRGIQGQPSEGDFVAAFRVMQAFAQQRQDNPPAAASEAVLTHLPEHEHATLVARAFLMFCATKPTAEQWQAVRDSLQPPSPCNRPR
jgi:hypothetical protein